MSILSRYRTRWAFLPFSEGLMFACRTLLYRRKNTSKRELSQIQQSHESGNFAVNGLEKGKKAQRVYGGNGVQMRLDRNTFIKLVGHDFSVFAGVNRVMEIEEWLELLKDWANVQIELYEDSTGETNGH